MFRFTLLPQLPSIPEAPGMSERSYVVPSGSLLLPIQEWCLRKVVEDRHIDERVSQNLFLAIGGSPT